MHATSHSFPIEQFQHLPNPYPHDAIRDSFLRTNIVNLDLASPPPQRYNPRSHPLTPPDTPGHRRVSSHNDQQTEPAESQTGAFDTFSAVGLQVDVKNRPTRYLVVGGVPSDAPTSTISRVFTRMGDLKGMFVRYQKDGIVVLSWHDIRHAKKAHSILCSNLFFGRKEPLAAAFIAPFHLIKATGESPFVNGREGNLTITAEQAGESNVAQPVNLHAAFALFGELSSFYANQGTGTTTYFASYYDAREADNAAKSLHGRSILGMLIRVSEGFPEDEKAMLDLKKASNVDRSSDGLQTQTMPRSQAPKKMQYSYSSASRRSSHHDLRRVFQATDSSPNSNAEKAQATDKKQPIEPLSPSSTISGDHSTNGRPVIYRTQTGSDTGRSPSPGKNTIFSTSPSPGPRRSFSGRSDSPGGPIPRVLPPRLSLPWLGASMPGGPIPGIPGQYPHPNMYQYDKGSGPFPPLHFNAPHFVPNQYSPPSFRGNLSISSQSAGPSTVESGPTTPVHNFGHGYSPALSKKSSFDRSAQISATHSRDGSFERKDLAPPVILPTTPRVDEKSGPGQFEMFPQAVPPERNGVDVGRIEAGLDTRTTVMLKNVPNKMSDADLRKYISEVVPNSFDFVYLRFDFHSSANVGYAFVNFVTVADLLKFAKARLGVKWNMFCSEKVLQMSYANFQGKEALVEKFKNSCVMEMQDEWVPKIFYSSGPNKGQRESFPPATNPSRARRSQDQRERGLLRTNNLYTGPGRHLNYKPSQ